MVLLLRHSDQVLRVRASSTCECDSQFTQEENLSTRGLKLAHHVLWHLPAPSLPLSSGGSNHSWTPACSRSQRGLYRQAARFPDPPSPPAGSARTRRHQPAGGSGSAARLGPASRTWLSASASVKFVAKINTCMIVCRLKRYRRFITGWCPTNPRANPPRS